MAQVQHLAIQCSMSDHRDPPPSSSHTMHISRAVDEIRHGMEKLSINLSDGTDMFDGCAQQQVFHSAWVASQRYKQDRDDGLKYIHTHTNIDEIICNDMDTYKFKQQYINRNIPCIIRGMDKTHFADISTQWRCTNHLKSNDTQINTDWFTRFVGNDTLVPVRFDLGSNHDANLLDDDGRAQECETKQMKLSEWISDTTKSSGYLKDWHLVEYLSNNNEKSTDTSSSCLPLYTTPDFFERDLLNNFLLRYQCGDYKFVYWGPAGSKTHLHSDVMHSFSWSYNVVGKKKWIFHVPSCYNESNTVNVKKVFEVIQNTGELMFVPATWKHEVVNLVETISINHNWITASNIDKTWECMMIEMQAIEKEVNEWGIPDGDFGARENMLRGCIGLNVTMFTLMMILEMVELLMTVIDSTIEEEDKVWDCVYSIFRLEEVLTIVLRQPNVLQRLGTILDSEPYALEIEKFATALLSYTSKLKRVTI